MSVLHKEIELPFELHGTYQSAVRSSASYQLRWAVECSTSCSGLNRDNDWCCNSLPLNLRNQSFGDRAYIRTINKQRNVAQVLHDLLGWYLGLNGLIGGRCL